MAVILITGCGHGLGLEMARMYSKIKKHKVVVTARALSIEELTVEFKNNKNVMVKELDLTKPESFESILKDVYEEWGKIDILVNNAAISYRAVLEHVEDHNEKLLFQTNYFGPRELIRQAVPRMKEKGGGKIINISSVGGMMAMPTMSSYSASKFALEGMSEALWYELKPFNISVSIVQLGFINSSSFKRVIVSEKMKQLDKDDVYLSYYEGMSSFVSRIMKITPSTPEKIAKKILCQIINKSNPKLRVPATIDAWFFSWFRTFVPQRLYHSILYNLLPSSFKKRIKEFLNYLET